MKRIFALSAASVALCVIRTLGADSNARPAPRHPNADETYTITATLELVKPFNPEVMTDDFQEARVISQDADSCTVEITYYPLFRPAIGENANWRRDYAHMTQYLAPTATEN